MGRSLPTPGPNTPCATPIWRGKQFFSRHILPQFAAAIEGNRPTFAICKGLFRVSVTQGLSSIKGSSNEILYKIYLETTSSRAVTWYTGLILIRYKISRGGYAQLFFESAIAILQLEISTSAIAIPQFSKKCCSATATPQFSNRNFS